MAVGRRNHRHTIHNAYTCMCVCMCTWDILVYSCIAISELMISIINTPNIRQTDRQTIYIFRIYIFLSALWRTSITESFPLVLILTTYLTPKNMYSVFPGHHSALKYSTTSIMKSTKLQTLSAVTQQPAQMIQALLVKYSVGLYSTQQKF